MTKSISERICNTLGIDYIDFTEPVNFVKLLNVVYQMEINNRKFDFMLASMTDIYDDVYIDEPEATFEETYLLCLNYMIHRNNPDSWDLQFEKNLKEAISTNKWLR